jgi:hypothetical protein
MPTLCKLSTEYVFCYIKKTQRLVATIFVNVQAFLFATYTVAIKTTSHLLPSSSLPSFLPTFPMRPPLLHCVMFVHVLRHHANHIGPARPNAP